MAECCKQGFKGRSSRRLEDISAETNMTIEAQIKRIQGGTILATRLETGLVIFGQKNTSSFCPCPKNLPEAELKSFGLIS